MCFNNPTKMDEKELIRQTLEKYKNYINPSMARLLRMTGAAQIEVKARGATIKTSDGKKFIDCLGSYGVFNVGHAHPKVVAAVRRQLLRMPLASKIFLNKPLADLAELLAKITPGDLQYSFICNSGAEAIEAALKIARLHTRRSKIISTVNAFHGKTLGALSVSGREIYKKPFEPLLPDCVQIPYNDVSAMKDAVDDKTAAVILEPVQGEGGVNVPEHSYLQEACALTKEKGAVLILDEVQTGFGRTGKMFACEHSGIVPDLLVLAKALGGGVIPCGAVVGTPAVWKELLPNPLLHTTTFGGNPLACTAAIAGIQVILNEHLAQKSAEFGSYFLSKLSALQREFPDVMQQVRGLGLMIGVELTDEAFGGILMPEMLKRGVLIAYTLNNPKVVRFEPPLVITKKEIDVVLSAFYESLEKAKMLVGKL